MTELELSFFADLGLKLGFIPVREYYEDYPRDLVWVDPEKEEDRIFLHVERENEPSAAVDAIKGNHKLRDSALRKSNRYLVGVFGFVTKEDLNTMTQFLKTEDYRGRNILIIAFVGDNKDKANDVRGLVYSEQKCWERKAKANMDRGGFWHLYFDKGSKWKPV